MCVQMVPQCFSFIKPLCLAAVNPVPAFNYCLCRNPFSVIVAEIHFQLDYTNLSIMELTESITTKRSMNAPQTDVNTGVAKT